MWDEVRYITRRRITVCVVLLFCFSLGLSQVKVERSIFVGNRSGETIPTFLENMRFGSGVTKDFHAGDSFFSFGGSLANIPQSQEQDTVRDSLGFQAGSVMLDTGRTKKSPGLAMLMSMVLPGAGQVYVHRYITIPIIWGFGYYFAKAWNDQNNRYIYYRNLFDASRTPDSLGQLSAGNALYQSNRDFYRDDRDKFAFYLAITYILNIVDAYVGASLYSFDVSDNLGGSAAFRVRIPIE